MITTKLAKTKKGKEKGATLRVFSNDFNYRY